MKLRNLLLAATLLALPVAVKAQPVNGLYVGGGAGLDYQMQLNASSGNPAFPNAKLQDSFGPALVGSVGYGFGNGVRVEVELNGRYESVKATGYPGSGGSGSEYTYGTMLNGLYDFDVGAGWIYPYVGAGVGLELRSLSGARFTNNTAPGTTASFKDGAMGGVGGQGIIGASFPITGVPGLSMTAEYRFMGVFTNNHFGASTTAGGVAGPSTDFHFGNQYHHSLLVGVRYAFGVAPAPMAAAPAPAPRAAPTPAPARTYLVFFDWDKADLTTRARQIIAEAAQASTSVATTQIEVSGNADTSGTPAYNQGLSMRRAQAVGAELVRDGVNKNIIMIQAFGDTRPLVATGPGVREPQNRRVEIVLK